MDETTPHNWEDDIFDALKKAGVSQIPYVPDAGHSHLIRRVHSDPDMTPIVLTTEEEGIASSCGANMVNLIHGKYQWLAPHQLVLK